MKLKPLKILFVVETLGGHGGMENVTRQVINLLNDDPAYSAGIYLFESNEKIASNVWSAECVWGQSRRVTRNPKISRLIHTLRFAWFVSKHKPDHVIAMNTIPCLLARKALKLAQHKVPLYSWMHLPPKERYRPHYLMLADKHLAISQEIKHQLISLGALPEQVHVVFNPVKPVDNIIPRPDVARFLFVGRVHFQDQKQLKDLLDALCQVKGGWSLDIVGEGNDRSRCERYAIELGLADKIIWHGWQTPAWDYVESHIKTITSLVLTSNHEGFPLTLLEAMARGVFCVSSDCVSGPAEIISHHNGQLYPVNDVDALARILQRIVDGVELPNAMMIKASVSKFSEPYYIDNIKNILVQDNKIERE